MKFISNLDQHSIQKVFTSQPSFLFHFSSFPYSDCGFSLNLMSTPFGRSLDLHKRGGNESYGIRIDLELKLYINAWTKSLVMKLLSTKKDSTALLD